MKSTYRVLFISLFLLSGFQTHGQVPDSIRKLNQARIEAGGSPDRVISVKAPNYDIYRKEVKRMAEYDVAHHNIWLVHRSDYFLDSADSAFQEKYELQYYCGKTGCIILPSRAFETYNEVVAEYLDHTYGKVWRTEVTKTNICGIKPEND